MSAAESRWIDLDLVEAFVPLAALWGVSEVARSSRGFLAQYRRANGDFRRLTPEWRNRRNNFVARHWAQVEARGEAVVDVHGVPSRRMLALLMWAAAPGETDDDLVGMLRSASHLASRRR